MNITKHDVKTKNTQKQIIQNVIIKKCFHYYKFEKMMKNSSIINFSFLIKSVLSISNFRKNSQEKKSSNDKNEINVNDYKK